MLPKPIKNAKALASICSLAYALITSFQMWKSPFSLNIGTSSIVDAVGGLYLTTSAVISLSPRMNPESSGSQPNCLRASSASVVDCNSSTHLVIYAISIFCLVAITAIPCLAIVSLNLSVASTSVNGMINSLTPSFGKCKRSNTLSPLSGSFIRLTA